ncbi:MAG: DUF1127 domain-containing protein [Mesorhizobium sp.]|nr:MAG: DUF1127 domain-containing protein [Mesorhizobium sp.]TIW00408.1 MAG: DUF1127 domain-containing protein [Mesorhizobium sp.]TJW87127.1 MAG: DUF1127 domain-containing protein [Mesorhizobium sp.]
MVGFSQRRLPRSAPYNSVARYIRKFAATGHRDIRSNFISISEMFRLDIRLGAESSPSLHLPLMKGGWKGENAMATIEFPHSVTTGRKGSRAVRSLLALLHGTIAAVLWLPRFWVQRKQLAVLASMSTRELLDIGLNASDIANALAQRNDQDPTVYLADVARERRLRRQA